MVNGELLLMVFSPLIIVGVLALLTFFNFVMPYQKSAYAMEKKIPWYVVLFDKGLMGEYKIGEALEKIPGCRKLLYNVYVPIGKTYVDKQGKTHKAFTELDIVLIHERGIFVIESKRYQGWIFGTDHQYRWTISYRNGSKIQFRNPIGQNEHHIETIRAWMQSKFQGQFSIQEISFINLVVFSGECELKKISVSKKDCFVTRIEKLTNVYTQILKSGDYGICFTPEQVVNLYREMRVLTKVSPEEKRAHNERVKQIQKEMEVASAGA